MKSFHLPLYYKLIGKLAVPCNDFEFAIYLCDSNRVVAKTEVGPLEVSTVFLGLDHNWGRGDAILFETMIFHIDDCYCQRYRTWAEAEEGHAKAVKWAELQVAAIKERLKSTHPTYVQDEETDA